MDLRIRFSIPEIRATALRTKTQFRRVVDLEKLEISVPKLVRSELPIPPVAQAEPGIYPATTNPHGAICAVLSDPRLGSEPRDRRLGMKPGEFHFRCPYGDGKTVLANLGERQIWMIVPSVETQLRVCETWSQSATDKYIVGYRADGECGAWMGDGAGGWVWVRHGWINGVARDKHGAHFGHSRYGGRWRPWNTMPPWASRFRLAIRSIRFERLQDITRDDAIAEGIPQTAGEATALGMFDNSRDFGHEWDNRTSVENFAYVWDATNMGRGVPFSANPWCWVGTYELVPRQVF